MGIDKRIISEEISRITGGKRSNMKAVLEALEEHFSDIAFVAVDKSRDVVLFGSEYLDEQMELHG